MRISTYTLNFEFELSEEESSAIDFSTEKVRIFEKRLQEEIGAQDFQYYGNYIAFFHVREHNTPQQVHDKTHRAFYEIFLP